MTWRRADHDSWDPASLCSTHTSRPGGPLGRGEYSSTVMEYYWWKNFDFLTKPIYIAIISHFPAIFYLKCQWSHKKYTIMTQCLTVVKFWRILTPATRCQVLNLSQLKSHEEQNSLSSSVSDRHLDLSLAPMLTHADDNDDILDQDESWRLESCLASFDYHHHLDNHDHHHDHPDHHQERERSVSLSSAASCIPDIGEAQSIEKCRKKVVKSGAQDVNHHDATLNVNHHDDNHAHHDHHSHHHDGALDVRRKRGIISRRMLVITQNIRAMLKI